MATKKKATVKQTVDEDQPLPTSVGALDEMCSQLWEEITDLDEKDPKRAELILKYNIAAGACNTAAGVDRVSLITKKTVLTGFRPDAEAEAEVVPPAKGKGKQSKADKQAALGKVVEMKQPVQEEHKEGDEITFAFAGGTIVGIIEKVLDDKSLQIKGHNKFNYHIQPVDVLLEGETAASSMGRRRPTGKSSASSSTPRAASTAPKKDAPPKRTELQKMKMTPAIKKILDNNELSGADKIRAVYDMDPKGFDVEDFVLMSGINRSRTKGCLDKFRYEGWDKEKK
jgi:hypothetical protein